MKKSLIPCFLVCLIAISCSKDSNPDPTPTAEKYMTITTNSKWTYDVITNPGPTQTSIIDTVTATGPDTTINSRSYKIFKHSNGNISDYYNISGNDYYRYQKQDLNGTMLEIDELYLKEGQSTGYTWSNVVTLDVSGFPVPVTITHTILETDGSKTVNGTLYTKVITVKTDITSTSLPPGYTLVTDIKSYYSPKFGMIQGDYKVQLIAASIDINTQTLLKTAVLL
jgi:hypothetical protein